MCVCVSTLFGMVCFFVCFFDRLLVRVCFFGVPPFGVVLPQGKLLFSLFLPKTQLCFGLGMRDCCFLLFCGTVWRMMGFGVPSDRRTGKAAFKEGEGETRGRVFSSFANRCFVLRLLNGDELECGWSLATRDLYYAR